MEALRAEYASDSSEDGTTKSENADSCITSTKPCDRSSIQPGDSVEDCKKVIPPKYDFFGLVEPESETDEVQENDIQEEVSKVVKVDGKDTIVNIPGSDFWSSVGETDLQILQTTNTSLGQERCASDIQKNKPMNHGTSVRKRHLDERQTHVTGAKVLRQDKTTSHSDMSRKMFFVHSKITPFLHKKCTNKHPHKEEWTSLGHAGAVNRVKWNIPSYSHLLVSCSMDSTIKIWNVWSQLDPCVKVLSSHTKAVRDVAWSHSGTQLISASYDKTAAITDVESGKCLQKFQHNSFVSCCLFHPTNPNLCVTGENNKIQIWDSRTPGQSCRTLQYKDTIGQVQAIVLSPDGSTLFSGSDLVSRDSADRNLMAWHMDTGVVLSNQIFQERFTVTRLKIHPTDHTLLAQCHGNYIAIFSKDRPYKMNKHKRFEGHKLFGYNIGFDASPDGRYVYSGSADGKLCLYDYQSGKRQKTMATGLDVSLDIDCHPVLPSTVAIAAWNGTLSVWK